MYVVNGVEYRNGYYLADGIYPEWASFVKSLTVATDPKHTYFKQRQESARKDVERAFGVLQGRWGLIQQPARAYEVNTLRRIMYAGIIMHNMILENQNMSIVDLNHVYSNTARSMQTMWIDRCENQRRKAKELRDRDTHISLQQNLMNHIWREVEEASEEDSSLGRGLIKGGRKSMLCLFKINLRVEKRMRKKVNSGCVVENVLMECKGAFVRNVRNKKANVMAIEESKDLSSLALDELIVNLKEKKSFRQRDDKKCKSDRKCFRCGDPNHLIDECPKPPRNKEQKAFVEGSWSDSEMKPMTKPTKKLVS
uniref:Putative nuclease HARBI1 n=1 Tax=Tanacetum cinerariifolium TaxID=118510 RepID=A0A6L2KV53_TANCI|nr:putative nuclease HARBI1 [Tanacetum cinerariifolium]